MHGAPFGTSRSSGVRKITFAVSNWSNECNIFAWQYLRTHILQVCVAR